MLHLGAELNPSMPDLCVSPVKGIHTEPSFGTEATIRWRKGELIGAGAFGRVFMGMNLDSGELLAVKQVLISANNVTRDKAQDQVRQLEEEVKLLQNLSHPNIVRYLGTAREGDVLNIFLEFVPGGSIASLLGKFGPFPEAVIKMYTRQLLLGLHYLHTNGIMHRDIKGANILVDNKGCIKLTDFGASKQVVELMTLTGAKSMRGTPYWMAPEVIRQTGHSLPADIWSVGCTIIEMATGKPPWSEQFQEIAALFHIGSTRSHPPIPQHLSHTAQDFLLKCLRKEPHLRATTGELLEHPFVNKEGPSVTISVSTQICHGGMAPDECRYSNRGNLLDSVENPNLALPQDHTMLSVGSENDLLKSFQKVCESGYENDSFNPIEEPTSFCSEYSDEQGHHKFQRLMSNSDVSSSLEQVQRDEETSGFSVHCGPKDDNDVTESRIRAFLDEKALELKRLQTPLYEEYCGICNVCQQADETESRLLTPKAVEKIAPDFVRSPKEARNSLGGTSACNSPACNNVNDHINTQSPRLDEKKGLVSPRVLNAAERERLWKEELQKELEMKREEKRMLSRLVGSTRSSPVSKSSSPLPLERASPNVKHNIATSPCSNVYLT